jgi:hypothetical protein
MTNHRNLLVIDSVISCVCGVGAGEVVCSDLRQDRLEREIDVEPGGQPWGHKFGLLRMYLHVIPGLVLDDVIHLFFLQTIDVSKMLDRKQKGKKRNSLVHDFIVIFCLFLQLQEFSMHNTARTSSVSISSDFYSPLKSKVGNVLTKAITLCIMETLTSMTIL